MPVNRKIPYARVVCDGHELEYVRQVLESGWLTTAGKAMEFEQRFAETVGAPYACAVNSCTSALHLALECLGVGPGSKVFVPTWTFTATAEVVRYLGADPVFLDVDYGTALLTPAIVAEAIERYPEVKVLMIVHFGGQPAAMVQADGVGILELCRRHGVRVVEDAAHAFPARRGGRMVGSFGDLTCFSFYANKTITTGEGGMLTTADEALYQRCKVMRLHGINRDAWDRFTSDKPAWEYDVIAPGYKYNLPDVNAAVGLAQLERAQELRAGRQRCAEHYYQQLVDLRCVDLPKLDVALEDHAWHLFPIVLNEQAPIGRDGLIERLAERGIGTSVHYKPIHRMQYYRDRYGLRPVDFPNAERIWRGCLSLPIYPSLADEELDYISRSLQEALGASAWDNGRLNPGLPPRAIVTAEAMAPALLARPLEVRPQRIHLSVPHMGGREQHYVSDAFASNWLSTVGPNLQALEKHVGERVGQPAVALASGTAAIHLGLRLLGVAPGDEVVSPSLTFVASCNPIRYLGARPVFLDSERRSWGLDPQLLADFLRTRAERRRLPRAVVAVHLFGQPADMDPILATCRRYDVPVLEDAAEALGSRYKGTPVGRFGDVSVFSFNGNKVITATSGGMLTSPHKEWVDKARFWSTQACDPDSMRNYTHSEMGYNYRMSNVLAGIALGQLEVLDLRVQQRRAVFERYRQTFADLPGIEAQPEATFGKGKMENEEWRMEEGRRLELEARSQKLEGGSEKLEVRSQEAEGGRRKAEGGRQRAEGGSQQSESGDRRSEIGDRKSLHTRWLSCFLIDETLFGMSAADLIRYLDAANVESRPVWKPMHTQPLYRGYECVGGEVAEDLNRRGICLPSSSSLSEEEQQFVIDRVREAHFQAAARRRDRVTFSAPQPVTASEVAKGG